jgi:putative ABC transport system substrate-binding protein
MKSKGLRVASFLGRLHRVAVMLRRSINPFSAVGIGRIAHPFGLFISMASLSVLGGSAVPLDHPPFAVYLGSVEVGSDKAYYSFVKEFNLRRSGFCKNASIEHVFASNGDEYLAQQAMRKVKYIQPRVVIAPNAWVAEKSVISLAGAGLDIVFYSQPEPYESEPINRAISAPHAFATGVTLSDDLDGKRLELLHEAFPNIKSVGVLSDSSWADSPHGKRKLAAAARLAKVKTTLWVADNVSEVNEIFKGSFAKKMDAWYFPPTIIVNMARADVLDFMKVEQKPAIFSLMADVKAGGLMAYTQATDFIFPALADMANRACNGESIENMPIERPRQYILSIHSHADLWGQKIHPSVASRADVVVP